MIDEKDLTSFFNTVALAKKQKKKEIEELVSTSFEDLFLQPLQEQLKPASSITKPKVVEEVFVEEKKQPQLIDESIKKLNETLTEPPTVKNKDPLTPLNQKFATLEDLNKHYSLFINRIQQQLASLGGGGETRFRYLDDVVGIATNPSAWDNRYPRFDNVSKTLQPSNWVDDNVTLFTENKVEINDDLRVNNGINVVGFITAANGRINTNLSVGGITTTNTLNVSNNASVVGIITVGNARVNSDLVVSNNVNVTGITTTTNAQISNNLNVVGISTFNNTNTTNTATVNHLVTNTVSVATTFVNTGSYTVKASDYYVGVSTVGICSITLPTLPTGRTIVIKDELGQAGDGNNRVIHLYPTAPDLIDNANFVTIAIDNGSLTLIYRNGWRII